MNTALTKVSSNIKTGPIPVSTTSKRSCPDSCPFKGAGCYADGGPLNIHWNHITDGNRGTDFGSFCNSVREIRKGQLWRHNQAGDLQGVNNHIDTGKLRKLTQANRGRKGFTYTHKPMLAKDVKQDGLTEDEKATLAKMNRDAVREANANGFTVNLSANNPAHADKLKRLNIGPVVTVVPADQNDNFFTPEGNKVAICPATQRDDVDCASCGLCQKQRGAIVGFPAHGMRKKAASEISSAGCS